MPAKSAAPKSAPATSKPAKKPKSAALPSPMHPPYLQMIKEAIGALKERTGSSQPAIAKFIEDKYKGALSPNFKKQLSVQLKKFAQSEKLVRVKNSFKIAPAAKKPATSSAVKPKKTTAKTSTAAAKRPATSSAVKPKKTAAKKPAASALSAGKPSKAVKRKASAMAGSAAGPKKKAMAKSGTTKRLSQVKTPSGMKKKPVMPKMVVKSLKAKTVVKSLKAKSAKMPVAKRARVA